jgi:hypothetical protein
MQQEGVPLLGKRKGLIVDSSFDVFVFQFQPVKDADPHFHHFLLSQTEKVSAHLRQTCLCCHGNQLSDSVGP